MCIVLFQVADAMLLVSDEIRCYSGTLNMTIGTFDAWLNTNGLRYDSSSRLILYLSNGFLSDCVG